MSVNLPEIEVLIDRIKRGDQQAFAEVYDRYCGALNGVVQRFVKDPDAAEDVLQDTFVKIWKNCTTYDDTKGSFFTWMLNIARNTAIDHLRKQQKKTIGENRIGENNVGLSPANEQNTNTIGLMAMVDKLNPDQRLMVEYLYVKGYTQQEVAEELEIPLGTVKTRTRMAMKELRKWFTILIVWI
jgi:RNA polymerase sigma-70 factor (ECF subfamily)